MKIASGQTILFTGDSITDCGRGYPVGRRGELGDGYVQLISSLLEARYPGETFNFLNTGISGHRVTDLAARWDDDVMALGADWVSIFVGINDVWRHFDSPSMPNQVSLDQYEQIYRGLIKKTLSAVPNLLLVSPYIIEPDREDPMRVRMDAYGDVVRSLAKECGMLFAHTQSAFDRFLEHKPADMLAADRVHPNQSGHMIIARCILDTLGFEWA